MSRTSRIGGVTRTVVDAWCKRDYGIGLQELRALIELQLGRYPEMGIGLRPGYRDRAKNLLPTWAKPRARRHAASYTGHVVNHIFGEPGRD